MAPTDKKRKNDEAQGEGSKFKKERKSFGGVNKKKWIPHNKIFEGSVKEGQGFAFKKKQKVKHEYNKLLRKEKKNNNNNNPEAKVMYKEEYPEHLKHLYLAEAEQLRNKAWTNRVNRSKLRMGERPNSKEGNEADVAETDLTGESELTHSAFENAEPATSAKESCPISNRMRKKMERKTSYQKTKEEFEKIQERRRQKKEAYLKNKQQREEAIQRYKQKKIETFRILTKKTKKGQPNLNVQMEFLLQKIEGADK